MDCHAEKTSNILTWTFMILFLMRDWRNTQTNLTSLNLFQWIYSINFIQFKWINCPETGFFSPVLHVLVLDGLAGGDAVRYVEVDELGGQLNHSRQSVHNLENVKKEWLRTVDYLHTVQWHLHVDQHRKILCYAGRAILWWMNMLSSDFFPRHHLHEDEEYFDGNHRVVLNQVWELGGGETKARNHLRIAFKFGQKSLLLAKRKCAL